MANWSDPRVGSTQPNVAASRDLAFDAGLRSHMLSVYNYMASGVLLTGVIAMLFAMGDNPLAFRLLVGGGPLAWVVMLAPLGIIFAMSFGANRMSTGTLRVLYWAYAALMGVSLSTIFFRYSLPSVAIAFFATSAGFGGLSLWGYTTKRDLSGMGTFMVMGLVGLLVAMVVNIFLRNPAFELMISAAGVLIFAGLTAYDTQKIKSIYFQVAGSEYHGKAIVLGALTLYLDFINMFLFILRLMGSSRN